MNPTVGANANYTVTFHETGLPNGVNWSVSQATSTKYSVNNTISFLEPNGSYNFIMGKVNGYRPLPSNFTVNVQGHNLSLVIIYVPVLYPVTFVETGLPANTFWNVTLGNQTNTSSNSTIGFMVMNGTYNYGIPDVDGIIPSTANGAIKVSGAPTKVFIIFTGPVNFTFFEYGLPSQSRWSVWINGSYHNSTTPIITVTLPNGTYNYLVKVPSGYSASPSQGKVNYSDNLIYIKISSLIYYEILMAILVILIGIFSTVYLRAARKVKRQSYKENEQNEKK